MKEMIKNMIHADLYRINFCKGIYIAFTLMLLLLAISIYLVSPGILGHADSAYEDNQMTGLSPEEYYSLSFGELRQLRLKSENYALDRDILAANINLYYVFIFLAAIVITCDLSSGRFKNTLLFSIDRETYYLGKCLTVSLLCLLFHFLNSYLAYFGNLIFNKSTHSAGIGEITKISLLQVPVVIALSMVLCGLAFVLKRTWLYNLVTIPLVFVFQYLLSFLASMLRAGQPILNYEYQMMFAKLARDPSEMYVVVCYLICVGTVAIFGYAGYRAFRKMDTVR